MSKAFHTWNETIGALYSPLMQPNGPPSNDELFARLKRMKSFRRFRALCEAIGLKPLDGAGEAKAAAWWLNVLAMPEDYHDKLWRLFADYIKRMQQRCAETERVLSVTERYLSANEKILTKTSSFLDQWFKRKNDTIANLVEEVQHLKERQRKSVGSPKDELNIRAREFLKKHPNAKARQLAKGIGCALGMVSKLPAWKAVQERRQKERGPKCPRAVELTPKLEKTIGQDADELQRLIDDQKQQGMTDGSLLKPSEKAKKAKFVPRRKV